jgi:hypothetical protein
MSSWLTWLSGQLNNVPDYHEPGTGTLLLLCVLHILANLRRIWREIPMYYS